MATILGTCLAGLLTQPSFAETPKVDVPAQDPGFELAPENLPIHADKLKWAVQANPDRVDLRAYYAMVLIQLERYDEAAEQLKAVVRLRPADASALGTLGTMLVKDLGQLDEGIGYLRRASVLAPSNGDIAYDLATALMRLQPPAIDEARSAFRRAVQDDPDRRQYLWDKVEEAEMAKQWDQARQMALWIAQLDHDSAVSQHKAAMIWLESRNGSSQGIDLLQRAFDVRVADPDDGVAPPIIPLAERLVAVQLDARRPADAETVARRLQVSRPTNEFANRLLIDVFVKTGRHVQAEATARQWAQSQPTSSAAHQALADCYLAREQWPLAQSAFERAAKAAPNDPEVYRHYAWAAVPWAVNRRLGGFTAVPGPIRPGARFGLRALSAKAPRRSPSCQGGGESAGFRPKGPEGRKSANSGPKVPIGCHPRPGGPRPPAEGTAGQWGGSFWPTAGYMLHSLRQMFHCGN